jgi:hypothetical protein
VALGFAGGKWLQIATRKNLSDKNILHLFLVEVTWLYIFVKAPSCAPKGGVHSNQCKLKFNECDVEKEHFVMLQIFNNYTKYILY